MQNDDAIRRYLEDLGPQEDEPLRAARARSEEADIPAVPASTGAFLRWLASLGPARNVVEIGSGGGYSGLWLLAGMDPKGILTTIETDPDHQALAQRAYAEAGHAGRVRSILGPALSVLPKLADATYDIVFVDAVKSEYPDYLPHARRLLRPRGLLVADNVFWHGRVADPADDSEDTQGVRAFTQAMYDDAEFSTQIVPFGDGLLVAAHRA